MSPDAKLLAVYEKLSKELESVKALAKDGVNGKDGKDGKDAPDISSQLFAAIGSLHSQLIQEISTMKTDVVVTPNIVVEANNGYLFDVERDDNGFIKRVKAHPLEDALI